jgi:hypothetical protein
MLTRKGVILCKIESSYGVDPTPTVADNAILVSNIDMKVAGEQVLRDYLKSSLSPLQCMRGIKHAEISFETELKGSGSRGSLPAWGWEGVLFRACGMLETVNAGASIVYTPVSTGQESCTLYVYKDGIFHKCLGCRGTYKINAEVGKPGKVSWKFNSLYTVPADATPASQTFSTVVPPICLGTTFTIDSYGSVFEKLELDINNSLAPRRSMNSATGIVEWIIAGRDPQGSFDPETVLEATKDYWADWAAANGLALSCAIGSATGNIITLAAPKAQYKEITYQDRNSILAYQIPLHLGLNSGDDELTITIT